MSAHVLLIEFMKRVWEKNLNAKFAEHFIAFSQRV